MHDEQILRRPIPTDLLPISWRRELKRLHRAGHPDAIIAGGALRDLMNERPIKDIDIFINPHALLKTPSTAALRGIEVTRTFHPGYVGARMASEVRSTYQYMAQGFEYNLIVLAEPKTPEEMVARMDFGLCQIGFDGEDLLVSLAFLKDFALGTFTIALDRGEHDHARSLKRYARLSSKYPDFPLIDPYAHKYAA